MTTPLACADLAVAVVAQPAPIVFLDTAAILDVLRVPFRGSLQTDIIDSSVACANDCTADARRLWLVTSANVIGELNTRRGSVEAELSAHLIKLASSVRHFVAVSTKAFPGTSIHFPNILALQLDKRMSEIADGLLDVVTVFEGSANCGAKARDRIWAGQPPASKAKQEFKDCEIFEEFLELTTAIRNHDCAVQAIFVTPNANDYGPPPKGHTQIEGDLTSLSAQYCSNLSWARSLLG